MPADVAQDRYSRLMGVQLELAFARAEAAVGQRLRVLVDSTPRKDTLAARHADLAPQIDALVAIQGRCTAGEFGDVTVTGAKGYGLLAKLTPTPKPRRRPARA